MADARPPLPQLKKLLFARDEALVEQGVELLRSLEDPALFDRLLGPVTWAPPPPHDGRDAQAYGQLHVGGELSGAPSKGAWDVALALRLIAAAPPESAEATRLIDAITSLDVTRAASYDRQPVDLSPLRALRNLERLTVHDARGAAGLDALAELPRLRQLALLRIDGLDDLSALSGSQSLETLTVGLRPFAPKAPLRDLPSLRVLDLTQCHELGGLDVARELAALEVLRVSLGPAVRDLGALRALTSLRALEVSSAPALASLAGLEPCAGLERVRLDWCPQLASLDALAAARSLRALELRSCNALTSLAPLDGLASLTKLVVSHTPLTDLDALAACDLRAVDLAHAPALRSLAGLRGTRGLTALVLANAPELRSLDGVEGNEGLERVSISRCAALGSVRALARAPKLTSLQLTGAAALASLAGVEGCAALVECVVEGAPIEGVGELAGKPELARVSLRGCARVSDVSPLAALPKLRALVLTGTAVDRSSLDANLRRVASFARDAELKRLEAKPPPAPRKPLVPEGVPKDHRKAWTRLKKLLLTRDPETVDQGVELVRALEDPALYAELLRGVTWAPPDRKRPCGELRFEGTFFDDTEPARPFRERAALALAAAAPGDCEPARALREGVTALFFQGNRDPKHPAPFDLEPLRAFTRLARLDVWNVPAVTHAEALEGHPSLAALHLRQTGGELPDLGRLARLEELSLHDVALERLGALRDAPRLKRLTVHGVRGDGALTLDGHAGLEALQVSSAPGVHTVSVRGCAALRDLNLQWAQGVRVVDATGCDALERLHAPSNRELREVRGLESLRSLQRVGASYSGTAWLPRSPLPALVKLTALELDGTDLRELSALEHFPALVAVSLASSAQLADVSALGRVPTLRSINLSWCKLVSDVSALAGLPLHALTLRGSGVTASHVPLALARFVR